MIYIKSGRRILKTLSILTMTLVLMVANAFGDKIRRVIFEQQGYEFPVNMLQYNLQLSKGEEFDQKILDDDVKRLSETGYFDDVSAGIEKTPDGRVDIVFKTTSKPKIKNIIFHGNKKFKDLKLRDKLTIEPGMPLNDKKLNDSLVNLRDFYNEEGYYDTTISPRTEDLGGGEVNLVFNIQENLRLRINSVDFSGNTVFYNLTLRGAVQTQHSYMSWLFNVGLYDRNIADEDKIRLRNLYWTKGYLDFNVTNIDVKELPDDPEYVNVTFNLEEGKPYRVGEVSVSGNERFDETALLRLLKMKKGDIFDYRTQERDIAALGRRYFPLGYADFRCTPNRNADYKTHIVDIDYSIIEGRQYMIRDINISGNHITKDKVIRRELPLQPGQPVNNDLIDIMKKRLEGLGYFRKVTIVTANTSNPTEKDIDIKVEEKPTTKLTLGAGYSDTDSFGGTIEFTQNNFDLFNPSNLFRGGGQRLSLRADVGFQRNEFLVSFTEPWMFDIPLKMKLEGYYKSRFYEDWDESHAGGSIAFTKKVFDDFTSITLGHRLEAVRVYDMDDDRNTKYFTGEEGSDFLSTTSLIISRDTRDSLISPTSGYLLSLKGEFNAADKVYYRIEAVASNYYPFFEDLFVLHTGIKYGSVGRIAGDSDSGMVPIYERYFMGGGNSVRGFPYREVGPEDRNEDVYGGQSMMLANIEITHPIWRFIRGAAFMDAGTAWKDPWDMDFSKMNMGVGWGVRLKLPQFQAPIKLDLAYPVINNQDGVDSKLRFSFNLGFAW
jgi:outer membrane protein insertion porin family